MARHYPSERRVERVVAQLIERFLALGSVNALAEALSAATDGSRIYPNRVHGLLSGDATRSINTSTLEAIERALERLDESEDAVPAADARVRIQQAVAAETAAAADPSEATHRVAEQLDVPLAVVQAAADVAPRATATGAAAGDTATEGLPAAARAPDWSWQDDAVARTLTALRKGTDRKVGLVIPTGGGKTRISLRVILDWLSQDRRDDSLVLWVTHRARLHTQARRALQRLLTETDEVPESGAALYADRVRFTMLSELRAAIDSHKDRIGLVVIDEAHHAAAPSYEPVFTELAAPGLFLTATPNRRDELPIGIDEIAYTVTYRELFERGCVIEPTFDPPLDLFGLRWTSPEALAELADYLLERAEQDFNKTLVVVSKRERAELLYEALAEHLDERPHHPLVAEDLAFVHAGRASGAGAPGDLLDEFAARPRGILVATNQLIGEGFDDPLIDATVVTYPSSSIGHLMQVAGRALRYAPGKSSAHVVQVRDSSLAYHFEQRWLYQDISDALRPDLVDLSYSSLDDLRERLTVILDAHHIAPEVRQRVADELAEVSFGDNVRLMLTGIPFYGAAERFRDDARWGAIFVPTPERRRFIDVFNDVSLRTDDVKEQTSFLRDHLEPDQQAGSLWKSYVDLVTATEYARRELQGVPYAGSETRGYRKSLGSTWLRYVTLTFEPVVPDELQRFLVDAVNKAAVITQFLDEPSGWAAATKLELPLTGYLAYLLSETEASWLLAQRRELVDHLRQHPPAEALDQVSTWRATLLTSPIPMRLVDQIAQLARPERFEAQYLALAGR